MTNESKLPSDAGNPADPIVPAPQSSVVSGTRVPRQITSATLLQGDREIQIVHGEEIYRLSLTRQGKLILHK